MLSSISPLGEQARGATWWRTMLFYLIGSAAGGLTVGGLAGSVGALIPVQLRQSPGAWLLIGVALLSGAVLDLAARGRALPSWRRQVNETWLTTYRDWVYGLGFGAQLGFGLVTIVTSTTTYATLALAALAGSAWTGALIGGCFGVARALPALALWRIRDLASLHAVFRRLERWASPVALGAQLALLVAGLAMVVTAAAGTGGSS